MQIITAVQKGNQVFVYDEKNRTMFAKPGELRGYTGGSVSVWYNGVVYTYNEKGQTISAHPGR